MGNRAERDSWRLQSLTSLDVLPDYDDNPYGFWNADQSGHRSSPTARPSTTASPRASQKAKNDGQRWRWRCAQAARGRSRPAQHHSSRPWPAFCSTSSAPRRCSAMTCRISSADGGPEASGPYALDTLKDDETIARLASGIKRFKLPDEFNPIKIYQAIADDPKTGQGEHALDALASIFENRRQLDRAADYLKKSRRSLR